MQDELVAAAHWNLTPNGLNSLSTALKKRGHSICPLVFDTLVNTFEMIVVFIIFVVFDVN